MASVQSKHEFRISDLCEDLEGRLPAEQIREIYRAYLLAAEAHEHQKRKSGEPYIFHPLAVAKTVSEMRLDYRSIMAALLHDVVEDTDYTKEDIEKEFGGEVANLVDGLSKLTHLKFESKAEAQAANFRKMIMAMVGDMRIILIKLADRLHNMQTLGAMRPDKRRRIARETLEIYSPIAHRLGITRIKNALEDLGFKALYPARYRVLKEAVRKARGNRKELVNQIEVLVGARLTDADIASRVSSREKHLYSLFRKMRAKQLSFQDVYDMFAIRIVVNSLDECYRALGVMHNLYKPVTGHFKDYIAIPKGNGYQSLHTILFTPHGIPIEVQIRSEEMDQFAETGIAAHWMYKSGDDKSTITHNKARKWLSNLLDMQENAGSSMEFLENVKVDLFPNEIYVFSPRGDIYQLPQNATPVDFAYAVHTDIGNAAVTAKLDRRLAPLNTPLKSGQTIEIITSPTAQPSPLWLNFVTTAKARTEVRAFLKKLDKVKALDVGKRLIERALSRHNSSLHEIPQQDMTLLLHSFHFNSIDELFIDVGLGNHLPSLIASRLTGDDEDPADNTALETDNRLDNENATLVIEGSEGTIISLANCCLPLPGDSIQGFITSGKGVVVHAIDCPNTSRYRNRPKEWIPVEWSNHPKGQYKSRLIIDVADRTGALARIATTISNSDSNIDDMNFATSGGGSFSITTTIVVSDRKHLARVLRRLRNLTVVTRVRRDKH